MARSKVRKTKRTVEFRTVGPALRELREKSRARSENALSISDICPRNGPRQPDVSRFFKTIKVTSHTRGETSSVAFLGFLGVSLIPPFPSLIRIPYPPSFLPAVSETIDSDCQKYVGRGFLSLTRILFAAFFTAPPRRWKRSRRSCNMCVCVHIYVYRIPEYSKRTHKFIYVRRKILFYWQERRLQFVLLLCSNDYPQQGSFLYAYHNKICLSQI